MGRGSILAFWPAADMACRCTASEQQGIMHALRRCGLHVFGLVPLPVIWDESSRCPSPSLPKSLVARRIMSYSNSNSFLWLEAMMTLRTSLHLQLWILFWSSPCMAQYIVAHRGASFDAPENTLAAFQLAWSKEQMRSREISYLTQDQQIVCIHDKHTERVAPAQSTLQVASSTIEQLKSLDVGVWKDPKYQGERIPTLSEVLKIVPAGKRIFVEVKCGPEILPELKSCLDR